jgi:hypothetical protein
MAIPRQALSVGGVTGALDAQRSDAKIFLPATRCKIEKPENPCLALSDAPPRPIRLLGESVGRPNRASAASIAE